MKDNEHYHLNLENVLAVSLLMSENSIALRSLCKPG